MTPYMNGENFMGRGTAWSKIVKNNLKSSKIAKNHRFYYSARCLTDFAGGQSGEGQNNSQPLTTPRACMIDTSVTWFSCEITTLTAGAKFWSKNLAMAVTSEAKATPFICLASGGSRLPAQEKTSLAASVNRDK